TNPVILEYETQADWEAFRDAFTADLHPVGPVEEELARELALTQWRRRRIPAYEARCADRRLQTAIASLEYYAERESQQELEERAQVMLNEALLPNTEDLQRLLRYEAHLDRKFTTTLRHLHRLQQTRKQEEAENCKTNSAPHPQAPATSVPPVPSVPSVPSDPADPPLSESYRTNSSGAARQAARAASNEPNIAEEQPHSLRPFTRPNPAQGQSGEVWSISV
ncbi:MAG: hypothetical protein ACO1SX_12455, partial [Actinomycetota bacterium]